MIATIPHVMHETPVRGRFTLYCTSRLGFGVVRCELSELTSILLLAGWGHPEPASMFVPDAAPSPFREVRGSRYRSFDPRWTSDFDRTIAAYLASSGAVVVADYRKATLEAVLAAEGRAA